MSHQQTIHCFFWYFLWTNFTARIKHTSNINCWTKHNYSQGIWKVNFYSHLFWWNQELYLRWFCWITFCIFVKLILEQKFKKQWKLLGSWWDKGRFFSINYRDIHTQIASYCQMFVQTSSLIMKMKVFRINYSENGISFSSVLGQNVRIYQKIIIKQRSMRSCSL